MAAFDPPPYSQLGGEPTTLNMQPNVQPMMQPVIGQPAAYQPYQQPQMMYAPQPQVVVQQPVLYVIQPQQQPQAMMQPAAAPAPTPTNVTNNNTAVVVVHQQKDPLAMGQDAAATILKGGLCACLDDIPTCLCACFLPMCQNGLTAASAQIGNCLWCTLCYSFFPCCTGAIVRQKLHERAGLPDPGFVAGCCTHICCMCCAVAQEARAANKLNAANTLMSR